MRGSRIMSVGYLKGMLSSYLDCISNRLGFPESFVSCKSAFALFRQKVGHLP